MFFSIPSFPASQKSAKRPAEARPGAKFLLCTALKADAGRALSMQQTKKTCGAQADNFFALELSKEQFKGEAVWTKLGRVERRQQERNPLRSPESQRDTLPVLAAAVGSILGELAES